MQSGWPCQAALFPEPRSSLPLSHKSHLQTSFKSSFPGNSFPRESHNARRCSVVLPSHTPHALRCSHGGKIAAFLENPSQSWPAEPGHTLSCITQPDQQQLCSSSIKRPLGKPAIFLRTEHQTLITMVGRTSILWSPQASFQISICCPRADRKHPEPSSSSCSFVDPLFPGQVPF